MNSNLQNEIALAEPDAVVGHKTFSNPDGTLRHEPLMASEARVLMAQIEAEDKRIAELMPDEQSAINAMFSAYQRLKQLGWREAMYCPKDGSSFDAIEPGSTGIHSCHYSGEWPTGHWQAFSDGDLWPSSPILYRARPPQDAAP